MKSIIAFTAAGILAVLTVIGAAVFVAPESGPVEPPSREQTARVVPTEPFVVPLVWDPDHVVVTLTPGETEEGVFVTASLPQTVHVLPGALTAQVTPELAPYLTVEPATTNLVAGTELRFELSFDVPEGTDFQTIGGSLQLRRAGAVTALAQATEEPIEVPVLPIMLNVWPSVQNASLGVEARYLPGQSVDRSSQDPADNLAGALGFLQTFGDPPGSFYVHVYLNPGRFQVERFVYEELHIGYPVDVTTSTVEISGFNGIQFRTPLGQRIDTFVSVGDRIVSIKWGDFLGEEDPSLLVYESFIRGLVLEER